MTTIQPLDDLDRTWLAHVHPPGWKNPTPAPRYDLVVIGGGTAGLVCASGAAGLGARVALVERALLGGDCLNTGCVPSKTLLRSARAVHEARRGASLGVTAEPAIDFSAVMMRVRARRASLARHDSAARFASLGVDVFLGDAAFIDRQRVTVDGRTLRFRRAVIATGGRPSVPKIDGLADVPYLTNESLLSLSEQPRALIVIGAGPVGCEMAQTFALFGTRVTLLDAAARVLPRDDPDASGVLARQLERDGVRVVTNAEIRQVTHGSDGVTVRLPSGDITGDALLAATGRTPNADGLDLEAAGVATGPHGVQVDDRLRTSNHRIYAAGDVCSAYHFTHAADAMARIVIQNALFFGRKRMRTLVIPWCTYTFPEVAHVARPGVGRPTNLDEREAGATTPDGRSRITIPLGDVDRAVVDDETEGFVRIDHDGGRLRSATIVAPHAGELIGHLAYVMRHGGTLADLSATVFPYPTVAEALRKAGDAHRRGSLTPAVSAMLRRYFALLRRL